MQLYEVPGKPIGEKHYHSAGSGSVGSRISFDENNQVRKSSLSSKDHKS